MSAVTIRPLQAEDRAAWQPLWEAYLAFYESPEVGGISDRTFARLIGGGAGGTDSPGGVGRDEGAWAMGGFVAQDGEQVVGIAHAVLHPSTWSSGPACYLEDLFVDPAVRGGGVGRALIEAVTAWGHAAGAERTYWITRESNAVARRLYDTLATAAPFVLYERPTS